MATTLVHFVHQKSTSPEPRTSSLTVDNVCPTRSFVLTLPVRLERCSQLHLNIFCTEPSHSAVEHCKAQCLCFLRLRGIFVVALFKFFTCDWGMNQKLFDECIDILRVHKTLAIAPSTFIGSAHDFLPQNTPSHFRSTIINLT